MHDRSVHANSGRARFACRTSPHPSPRPHRRQQMTEDQIKHMVNRFLGWRLPENFNPDDGISFNPIAGEHGPHPFRRTPSGTNLFDAMQADAMVRYMVEGLPAPSGNAPGWGQIVQLLLRAM